MGVITSVTRTPQRGGEEVFNFVLPAKDLLRLCKVERFGSEAEGVNRAFNESHAIRMSEAMLDQKILWLEPLLGDLRGDWRFRSKNGDPNLGDLIYVEGTYISIDDGQHRLSALHMLVPSEMERLTFSVTTTKGLPYERRLRIFRMQMHRRAIDARLDLAQRDRLDDWKSPLDGEAYKIVLELSSNPSSPLKGKIILDEQGKRPYEARHRPQGINGKGLHATVRTIIGPSSPLQVLTIQKRMEVIMNLIRMAADIWPNEWKSEKHVLTTARGINAIVKLMVSSPNFRGKIGEDFSQESLREALAMAESFDWTVGKNRHMSDREIVDRLDQSIGRNMNKARLRRSA